MMRWIVASSIRLRFIVVAMAAGDDGLRLHPAAEHAVGCVPGVRPAAGGDPDDQPRTLLDRRRVSRHGAARGGAQRRAGARDDPIEVGVGSVVDPAPLQAGDRPPRGAPAGLGARPDRHAESADVGGSPGDDAAGIGHPPGDARRTVVRFRFLDRDVDDRLLEDPSSPAPRARCGQRRDLGRTAATDARAGHPEAAPAASCVARRSHDGHRGLARRGSAEVLGRSGDRHRWVDGDAQSAARHPPHPADHLARGHVPGGRQGARVGRRSCSAT